LAGALAGYSVWVIFNFDWAPATGAFWLLAGTLWSATLPRLLGSPAEGWDGAGAAPPPASPDRPDAVGVGAPKGWGGVIAAALVLAAVVFAVLPILADTWYLKGRAELAVQVDPLQAQYHWALGQGLVARKNLGGGVAELKQAADLGETEPSLYVELGDREAQLDNRAEARRAYRRALEIDPYYTPARQRLTALG